MYLELCSPSPSDGRMLISPYTCASSLLCGSRLTEITLPEGDGGAVFGAAKENHIAVAEHGRRHESFRDELRHGPKTAQQRGYLECAGGIAPQWRNESRHGEQAGVWRYGSLTAIPLDNVIAATVERGEYPSMRAAAKAASTRPRPCGCWRPSSRWWRKPGDNVKARADQRKLANLRQGRCSMAATQKQATVSSRRRGK
jgi:hypothetical protein